MKTTNIVTFILLLVIPFSLQAQTPVTLGDYVFIAAEDPSSNYTESTLSAGANEGVGFTSWSFTNSNGSSGNVYNYLSMPGFFAVKAVKEVDPVFGFEIDGIAAAERTFKSVMKPGDKVSIDIAFYYTGSYDTSNEIIIKLLSLTNSKIELRFKHSDGLNWSIYDGGSLVENTGVPITPNVFQKFEFQYNGNSSYTYKIGNSTYNTHNASSDISQIDALEIYVKNLNGNRLLGYKNLVVESKYTVEGGDFILNTDPQNGGQADQNLSATDAPLFEIREGSSLTVPSDGSLQVNGVFQNDGDLILESASNSYSSFVAGSSITEGANSSFTYKRHIDTNTNGNDLISSPFGGLTFKDDIANQTSVLYNNGTTFLFGPYNTGSGYQLYTSGTTDAITLGKGYVAGASAANALLSFSGTANHIVSNVTETLQIADANSSIANDHWNLVGNPYPSYLNVGELLGTINEDAISNTPEFPFYAVYGFNSSTNMDGSPSNWTVWDLNNSNNVIAPGQGFFVAAASNGATLTFTPSMQRVEGGDDFIAGRSTNQNFAKAVINLEAADNTHVTNLYFRDTNALGYDKGYDTAAYDGTINGIYSRLADGTGDANLYNQALSYSALSNAVVPLAVNADQGEQLTFSLNDSSQLPDNTDVYLEDTLTSAWTLLNDIDYTFTPTTAINGAGRFYIHFIQNTLSNTDQVYKDISVSAPVDAQHLVVSGNITEGITLELFDMLGKSVLHTALQSHESKQYIPTTQLTKGVYIAQLTGPKGQHQIKLLIQ